MNGLETVLKGTQYRKINKKYKNKRPILISSTPFFLWLRLPINQIRTIRPRPLQLLKCYFSKLTLYYILLYKFKTLSYHNQNFRPNADINKWASSKAIGFFTMYTKSTILIMKLRIPHAYIRQEEKGRTQFDADYLLLQRKSHGHHCHRT